MLGCLAFLVLIANADPEPEPGYRSYGYARYGYGGGRYHGRHHRGYGKYHHHPKSYGYHLVKAPRALAPRAPAPRAPPRVIESPRFIVQQAVSNVIDVDEAPLPVAPAPPMAEPQVVRQEVVPMAVPAMPEQPTVLDPPQFEDLPNALPAFPAVPGQPVIVA